MSRWYAIAANVTVAMKACKAAKAYYKAHKTYPPFLGNSLGSIENCLKRLPEDPLELMVGLFNYYVIYFDEDPLCGDTKSCTRCEIRPLTDEEREFVVNHEKTRKERFDRFFPIIDEDLETEK